MGRRNTRLRAVGTTTALIALLALLMPASATHVVGRALASTGGAATSVRLSGRDRVATAAAVAEDAWAVSDVVVIARSDDPADALAGTPLAAALDAPLVVTPPDHLSHDLAPALERLRVRRAVLLGGEAALSVRVATDLERLGIGVERVYGRDRYATAAEVARRLGATDRAFVVGTWRDALAVSGVAAARTAAGDARPILLAGADLPAATADVLADLGVATVDVADGDGTVASSVDDELRARGHDPVRLVADGPETLARVVAEEDEATHARGGPDPGPLVLATARTFPDGLSAGALVARLGGTLVLAEDEALADPTRQWVRDRADAVTGAYVIGGVAAIPAGTRADVMRLLGEGGAPLVPLRPDLPDRGDVDVVIDVGDDPQAVVDAHPPGTHYLFATGVHRLASVTPQPGDRFTGEPGAVLSGAKVLDGWQQDDEGRWYVDGQTQRAERVGVWGSGDWRNGKWAQPGHEREVLFGEELFVDGVRQRLVNGYEDLDEPGEWLFDDGRDRIIVVADPRDHLVETSVEDYAIRGWGINDVTIENLEVRHYATRAQRGPLSAEGTRGWRIRYVTVHDNHAAGIHVGPGTHLSNCWVYSNGQLGIGGHGEDVDGAPTIVERCEVAHNHQLGFDPAWEAGGIKIKHARDAVVQDTWVHHQGFSKGIWFDGHSARTTIQRNLVEANGSSGIFYEISHAARIVGNLVRNNGTVPTPDLQAGIFVVDSPGVEVAHNVVYDNGAEIMGSHQERGDDDEFGATGVRDLYVHHNRVGVGEGAVGIVRINGTETDPYDLASRNRFEDNTYLLRSDASWRWRDALRTRSEWVAAGHDRRSEFIDDDGVPAPPPFELARYGTVG